MLQRLKDTVAFAAVAVGFVAIAMMLARIFDIAAPERRPPGSVMAPEVQEQARPTASALARATTVKPSPPARVTGAAMPVMAIPTYGTQMSGGLGLTQEEWERLHGPPLKRGPGYQGYDGGRYAVLFMTGAVHEIERIWPTRVWVSLDEAGRESRRLMPADAQLFEISTPLPLRTVHTYYSQSLALRMLQDSRSGGSAGWFAVVLRHTRVEGSSDPVASLLIGPTGIP